MELITGFEPVTSSLPIFIIAHLFQKSKCFFKIFQKNFAETEKMA